MTNLRLIIEHILYSIQLPKETYDSGTKYTK